LLVLVLPELVLVLPLLALVPLLLQARWAQAYPQAQSLVRAQLVLESLVVLA
jgi:hypothetical protein